MSGHNTYKSPLWQDFAKPCVPKLHSAVASEYPQRQFGRIPKKAEDVVIQWCRPSTRIVILPVIYIEDGSVTTQAERRRCATVMAGQLSQSGL